MFLDMEMDMDARDRNIRYTIANSSSDEENDIGNQIETSDTELTEILSLSGEDSETLNMVNTPGGIDLGQYFEDLSESEVGETFIWLTIIMTLIVTSFCIAYVLKQK